MSYAVLLATLVVVLFCGKFASFVKVISVAKPSAAQAKFLDFEIGASIHFNMQTFSRTMKPGELIWSKVLFPSIEHTIGSYLTPTITTPPTPPITAPFECKWRFRLTQMFLFNPLKFPQQMKALEGTPLFLFKPI